MYETLTLICGHICHQIPARSISICGNQLPLCARCTGLYAGMIVCIICIPYLFNKGFRPLYILLFFSLLLNCITFIEFFDGNIVRFICGFILGTAAGLILMKSFKTITYQRKVNDEK